MMTMRKAAAFNVQQKAKPVRVVRDAVDEVAVGVVEDAKTQLNQPVRKSDLSSAPAVPRVMKTTWTMTKMTIWLLTMSI